jgi:hypothetical protein
MRMLSSLNRAECGRVLSFPTCRDPSARPTFLGGTLSGNGDGIARGRPRAAEHRESGQLLLRDKRDQRPSRPTQPHTTVGTKERTEPVALGGEVVIWLLIWTGMTIPIVWSVSHSVELTREKRIHNLAAHWYRTPHQPWDPKPDYVRESERLRRLGEMR